MNNNNNAPIDVRDTIFAKHSQHLGWWGISDGASGENNTRRPSEIFSGQHFQTRIPDFSTLPPIPNHIPIGQQDMETAKRVQTHSSDPSIWLP